MHGPKMIETQKDLHCFMQHNQPVSMVILDPKLQKHQRLLCQQCLDYIRSDIKMIRFEIVVKIIQESREQLLEILKNMTDNSIKQVLSFQNNIITLKQYLTQQLDQLIDQTKDWISNLESKVSKYMQYSFFQELDSLTINQYLIQNDSINIQNQIIILNECWSRKVNQKFEIFQSFYEYQKCQQILKDIMESSSQLQLDIKINPIIDQMKHDDCKDQTQVIKQIKIQEQLNPTNLVLIESIEQEEECRAIVFDPTGKKLISTMQNDIRIWNFDKGRMQSSQILQGHQNYVNCLVHSQMNNYFISGSRDNSIRLWTLTNSNLWESSQPYVEHKDYIYCMILTQKEELLISGSGDKSIKIWKVDFKKTKLQYLHSLERHNDRVFSLSLNDSERVLVSCEQRSIIIWKKKENNFWSFEQVINQEYGSHIKFIMEDQFIWVPERSQYLCVFEQKDGKHQENQLKRVILSEGKDKNSFNFQYFPIIYNKNTNLLCLRHVISIFILQVNNFGQISKIMELNCKHWSIYGTISNNGQYLIFWGELKKQYRVYEILYN